MIEGVSVLLVVIGQRLPARENFTTSLSLIEKHSKSAAESSEMF